jgi:cytochrome c-type biogenesis protein CcmH/NrfG
MKSLALAITITTLVVALSLHFVVDASDKSDSVAAHSANQADNATTMTSSSAGQLGSVDSMLDALEQRLQQQPDDGKGWLLLAKSYRHLGRMDDARDAYKKAEALGNGDATVAAQLFGLDTATVSSVVEVSQ